MTRHVSLKDFSDTLHIYQGSLYVNDFNKFGRTWQVIVQADARVPRRARVHVAAESPQQRRRDGAARLAGHG